MSRKKNIIQALLDEYDIKSAQDIQDTLKDLFRACSKLKWASIQAINHTNEVKTAMRETCRKSKSIRIKYGELEIGVPQDSNSSFEPQHV